MLGSLSEAEDAVQESWLHLNRSDTSGVENLGGWQTTVVARVCPDMLRSSESRREESLDASVPEPITSREGWIDPEQEALLADSVGLALLVVLDTLSLRACIQSGSCTTPVRTRLSFCMHGQSLLLGKQRSVGAASPPFPPARNRRPRRGLPDLACCSPQREIAQLDPGVPSCA
jgi:hypothetical protein